MSDGPRSLVFFIVGVLPLLALSDSPAAERPSEVVCRTASGLVTAVDLLGITCDEYLQLQMRHLVFNDLERLLKQTELQRKLGYVAGSDLGSLKASIRKHQESVYFELVKRAMQWRLIEEFVLKREPSPTWYYDHKKMREAIEYESQLWATEEKLWEAALAGMSAAEFEDGLRSAYKMFFPIGRSEQGVEQSIKDQVRKMIADRQEGSLERTVTARGRLEPRIRPPGDLEAGIRSRWIHAETYNWWTHYLLQRAIKVLEKVDPEEVSRPMIPRMMVAARVEREEDQRPIERLVASLGTGDRLDWTAHQQVVGFGREFRFTNRYLVSLEVTNGALARLAENSASLPKTPLEMPPARVGGGFWFEIFTPRLGSRSTNSGKVWIPVTMTQEGREWLKPQIGRLGDDPKYLRVWVGQELERGSSNWISGAGEEIRARAIATILKDDLKPALTKYLAEFTDRNPTCFPTADEVVDTLIPQHFFPYKRDQSMDATRMLKEPIPR